MHERLRHRLLGLWAHLMARRPRTVLLVALLLAAGSIVYTAMKLQFQPDRNDLLSPDLPWNQDFIQWQKRFPGKDDLILILDAGRVVAPGDPGQASRRQEVHGLVRKLAAALAAAPGVRSVEWGYPQRDFSPKTMRLLPLPAYQARLEQIGQSQTMLQSASVPALLGNILQRLQASEKRAPQPGQTAEQAEAKAIGEIDHLTALIQAFHTRLKANEANVDGAGATSGDALAALIEPESDPAAIRLLTQDDRFFFIRVRPQRQRDTLNEFALAITSIRGVMDRHRAAAKAAGFDMGLTGIPVIEMDETDIATWDSTIASIISVVLIYLLLMIAYYSVRTPLLLVASLLVGVAWSFGYVTLRIGHLQVISVVFTVMLLGLGIAYGIHLAARFELIRHGYSRGKGGFFATLRDTIETVGPGVFTGAITTAAAFVTTMFTDFKGVAEMGEIAGVGIMFCLLAMFSVYPACLRLIRAKHKHIKPMEHRDFHFFEERWVMPFVRRPKLTLIMTALLTASSLVAITQMYFDFDLLRLFPRGVDSVDWQARLSQTGRPIYFGVSVHETIPLARAAADKLRGKETVAGYGGIGLLFPDQDEQKRELLKPVRERLQPSLDKASEAPAAPQEGAMDVLPALRAMQFAFTLAGSREVPPKIREALSRLSAALTAATNDLGAMEEADRLARSARLHQEYLAWRRASAKQIAAALDPAPLAVEDFPRELLAPYIDLVDGRVALEIHPDLTRKGKETKVTSVLDPAFLPHYVREMRGVEEKVTGPAPQIYRSGVLIRDSYLIAGLFALGVVLVLVYLDFRRLADALLSLVPVSIGFALTFGIMYLCDMQINPANIIVLPLMFGIGVDAGVHMLHRYRQSPTSRPLGLTDGTGKGITITNLATVIGFGSMLIARHRGVQSLGFVLTVGIALTTIACWTSMPALLELLQRHREKKQAKEAPSR